MIAWLVAKVGLSPILWKLIFSLAVIGVISYGIYRYGTAQWEKGVKVGKDVATEQIEKAKKAEWELAQKKIESAAGEVEAERTAVNAQKAELNRSRLAITQALSGALASARAQQETAHEVVIAVPADKLDDAIRALSAALAAPAP